MKCDYCQDEIPKGKYRTKRKRNISYCSEWCKCRAERLRYGYQYKNHNRPDLQELDEAYIKKRVVR